MARDKTSHPGLYRCVEPFSVFRDGMPQVYGHDTEVLDSDPILRTHRAHFEPAASRVMRSSHIEKATAAPGELRAVSTTQHLKPQGVTSAQEQ